MQLIINRGNHSFGLYLPGLFGKRDEAVLVEVEPGDCIFFGPLVIHGSDANKSPHHRRANTFAYNVTNNDPRQCREVLRGTVLIDE
jgi:ectoine hydroxylase-related dioxygenase (phytanoyl-CoA dioxygenase family)